MKRVVITGLGVVSPIGTGINAFFDSLKNATPGIDQIQSFDASTFPTRIAGEISDFDFASVSLSSPYQEAISRDRKALFGIQAAREAIADAFINNVSPYQPEMTAAVIATGLELFRLQDLVPFIQSSKIESLRIQRMMLEHEPLSLLQIPAHLGAQFIADEIHAENTLSINVSACAAGTQALGEAYWIIREGIADMAIAGGYDSMINPLGVGGFCLLDVLSKQNDLKGAASRPFDEHRDGFVLGEGAGMCILESLEGALSRSAHIYAEILGYATTLDAYRVSDPAPDNSGAIGAMKKALQSARLSPKDIDYINAHGTGTWKNDPAETAAIHSVFQADSKRIPVSSTKSQLGHLIGSAGVVEFLAGIFSLENEFIPATINLTHPDVHCDLNHVSRTPKKALVKRFMSNSFGFGGQNAVIIAGKVDR